MHIVSLQAIQDAVSIPKAIDAVRDGLVAFAQWRVTQPEPMQLLFNGQGGELFGDCHAKAAKRKLYFRDCWHWYTGTTSGANYIGALRYQ